MAVGDLYRTAVQYNVAGQSNVNVMYFKQTKPMGQNNAQDFATEVAPLVRDLFVPIIADPRSLAITLTCTLVARLFSDVGESTAQINVNTPSPGLALPPANAMVLRIRTGLSGRTRRGRIFLGGVPASWITAGQLNTVGRVPYDNFMSSFIANFFGDDPLSGAQLGVFSRSRYAIISNPFDDYWKPAVQLQIPPAVATMRSRKVGVGA